MASALPLLLLGGAAVLMLGGKKKKRKSRVGEACDVLELAPSGYLCVDGVLAEEAIEERDLADEEPRGEEAGEFKIEVEDISTQEDEDVEPAASIQFETQVGARTCEEFLLAVHVTPTEPDELPIDAIAVEQTVMPAMQRTLEVVGGGTHGTTQVDPEIIGPQMVRESLAALVPACQWTYNEQADIFVYDNRGTIETAAGREVLFGLMELSKRLIESWNKPSGEPMPIGLTT